MQKHNNKHKKTNALRHNQTPHPTGLKTRPVTLNLRPRTNIPKTSPIKSEEIKRVSQAKTVHRLEIILSQKYIYTLNASLTHYRVGKYGLF